MPVIGRTDSARARLVIWIRQASGHSVYESMDPKTTIETFDAILADEGLTLEAVVIGAIALGLLGVITRETRDVDVLEPELPACYRWIP